MQGGTPDPEKLLGEMHGVRVLAALRQEHRQPVQRGKVAVVRSLARAEQPFVVAPLEQVAGV